MIHNIYKLNILKDNKKIGDLVIVPQLETSLPTWDPEEFNIKLFKLAIGERKWQPTPDSYLGNPKDRGALVIPSLWAPQGLDMI